jgi:DNA-binding NtrC family response regulator
MYRRSETVKRVRLRACSYCYRGKKLLERFCGAIEFGAFDCMEKPLKADTLKLIVKLALRNQTLRRKLRKRADDEPFGPC